MQTLQLHSSSVSSVTAAQSEASQLQFETSRLQNLKLRNPSAPSIIRSSTLLQSLKLHSCSIWSFTAAVFETSQLQFEMSQLQNLKLHNSKCTKHNKAFYLAAEFVASQLQFEMSQLQNLKLYNSSAPSAVRSGYLFDCGTNFEPCQKPHPYRHMENKFMKGRLPELCIFYRNKIKNRDAGFWQPTLGWYGSCV